MSHAQQIENVVQTKEYVLTEEEVVRIYYETEVRWALHWSAVIALLALYGLSLLFSGSGVSLSFACGWGTLFVVPCAIILVYPSVHSRGLRQAHRQKVAAGEILPMRHQFEPGAMTTFWFHGPVRRVKWAAFAGIVPGDSMLYLCMNRKSYVAVPRRVFDPQDDIRRLVMLCQAAGMSVSNHYPKWQWDSAQGKPESLSEMGEAVAREEAAALPVETGTRTNDVIVTKEYALSREQFHHLNLDQSAASLRQLAGQYLDDLKFVWFGLLIPLAIVVSVLKAVLMRELIMGALVIPLAFLYYVWIAQTQNYLLERRKQAVRLRDDWYRKRRHEIDAIFITTLVEGVAIRRDRLDHLLKIIDTPTFLMLHFSPTGAVIPIPVQAFQSTDDLLQFRERLKVYGVPPDDSPQEKTIDLLFLKITLPK